MTFTELWPRVVIAHRKSVYVTLSKMAGFKWRKAKIVLTSNDPEYHAKVEVIKQILSGLKEDEAFFSIDEYGPFAIKRKGGSKRVAPGENYVVPQYQKSKRLADPHGRARTIPKPNQPLLLPEKE